MKTVVSLVLAGLVFVGSGVAYACHDHCNNNVRERVVVRERFVEPVRERVVEYVEVPRVRVVERVVVERDVQVQKVVVNKQQVRGNFRTPARDFIFGGGRANVQKSVRVEKVILR